MGFACPTHCRCMDRYPLAAPLRSDFGFEADVADGQQRGKAIDFESALTSIVLQNSVFANEQNFQEALVRSSEICVWGVTSSSRFPTGDLRMLFARHSIAKYRLRRARREILPSAHFRVLQHNHLDSGHIIPYYLNAVAVDEAHPALLHVPEARPQSPSRCVAQIAFSGYP
jgi:hypothetical protein